MKAELYLEDEPSFRFKLLDGLTVGREGDVSVSALPGGQYVSRIHATFIKDGDGWCIRDEGSKNSTFVNSVKVGPGELRRLKPEDLVSLGYMSFIYTETGP